MAPNILKDEHEKIRKDLEKELLKARNLLDEKIGENRLNEYSVLCSHRISRVKTLSDALETSLENLALEVKGSVEENDFDSETSKDFASMDTAMELMLEKSFDGQNKTK